MRTKKRTSPLLGRRQLLAMCSAVVVLASVFGLGAGNQRVGAVGPTINFQARLMNSAGSIVSDGNYNVEFKIYTAASGGTANWTEDWLVSGSTSIHVANGYLTASLGTNNPFSNATTAIPWGQPLWLTMNIGGTGSSPSWDGEMSPRLSLTAVPAAMSLVGGSGSNTANLTFVSSFGQATQISLPDPGASTATVCYQSSTSCGFATGTAGSYIQNAPASQQTASFNIIGGATGTSTAVIQGAASGTVQVAVIRGGATPTATQDILSVQNAAGTSTFFKVDYQGNLTSTGNSNFNIGNANGLTVTSDLSGGGRSTPALLITQANDATNSNTSNLLKIQNSDSNSTAAALQISNVSAGKSINISGTTTGTVIDISASNLTTGTGFNADGSTLTSGSLVALGGTNAGATAGFTGSLLSANTARTLTSGSITDSGNFLNLNRANTVNNAASTFTMSGAVATLQSNCTQTAGTCTDTSNILNLSQLYANASGAVLNVGGAGTGNLAVLDATNAGANGVSIDVQSSSSSQYALRVTSNNGSTNLIYARADGNVGIGTTTPGAKLEVSGSFTAAGGAVQLNVSSANNTSINTGSSTGTVTIGNGSAGALSLQSGSTIGITTTNFSVSTAGQVTLAGGQSPDITTAASGAGTATSIAVQPGTSGAATTTGAAVSIKGGDVSGTTTVTGGAVTIQGGSTTGGSGTRNGGSVTVDGGTGGVAANNGTVSIGTTNASAITLGHSGITSTSNGNISLAAGQNLTLQSGSGVFTQTFTSSTAASGHVLNFSNTNTGAGVTVQGMNITPTNTATATSGTNLLNVMNFAAGGALGGTDQTNGINFASTTGYTNFINTPTAVLTSGGAFTGLTGVTLASGNLNVSTGTVQTAGTDRISNGGNLVNIGTITTSGAINNQTISSTANFTGTVTIQGSNALTLGVTGTATGAVLFKGATAASGTLTVTGPANPTTNTLTLPNETGTFCTSATGSTTCAGNYILNTTTVQTNASIAIQSAADANVTMLLKERPTQSADVIRVVDSNNVLMFNIDTFGSLHQANQANFSSVVGIGALSASSGEQLRIEPTSGSSIGLSVYANLSQTGDLINGVGLGNRQLHYTGDGQFMLRADAGQAVNLLQLQDSSNLTIMGVDGVGDTLNVGATGTVAAATTVNIGSSTGATQTVRLGGTSSGSAANGTSILLQGGNGASAVSVQSLASGTIGIGTNNAANTIQVGSTTLSSGTQTINIGANSTSGGTTNVTIGAGGSAAGGTTTLQSKGNTILITNGTTRATFDTSNNLYLGNGLTAAAPNNFTIQGTGSTTTAVAGGSITIQGGNATVGSANGGNVTLTGGTGIGTGATGLVVLNTPTFATATAQSCGTNCTITQSNIDGNGAVVINATAASLTVTMPDPTIKTAGRIVYVTAANGSNDFTLSVNGGGTGNQIAMRQNTTATMIWNGNDWTAAGASSSTTLQAAYDNTLTSAGGAELIVSNGTNANGLTIRDSSSNPVNGTLLEVQSSSAAQLFSVNGNVTDYVSDGGAETAGGTSSTFPASTWTAVGSSTVSRYTTTGSFIATGAASVSVATTTAANDGVKNTLSTSLTANMHYNVSFTARLSSGTFTDMNVYYSVDGTTASVACTTAQAIATSVWTKVNCTFAAPASGITSSNAILIRQTGSGTARTMYIDNLSVTIAADFNLATDGGVDDGTNFATNWSFVNATSGVGSVSRNTSDGNDASDSAGVTITTGAANAGIRNKLAINPLTGTLYRITVYGKLSSGTFTDFKVRYSRDGSTGSAGNYVDCTDYNTQTLTTGGWTEVTCYITTDGTAASNPYVNFVETTSAARTFWVDTFSMTLATNTTPNVQIGGGLNGGPVTLFTLDRAASAPIASNNDALLGSMYYDTSLGKLQCYEADGWGACGSSPDNIITISPEYTNAVLHGTGVGTMTSDICSDALNINDGSSGQATVCGTNETYNFYKWTSPQASAQTYSIYVTYQLPTTFKSFTSGSTSLMGRTDSSSATVQYSVYRNDTSTGLVQCGSTVSVSTGSVASWQTGVASGAADPSTCSFGGGDSIVFKIDVIASSNANAYVGNLNFTFSNK